MKAGSDRHAANRPSSKPVRVTRLRYTAGMIWSVSTLLRRSGTPTPVCWVNFSMVRPPSGGQGVGQVERAAVRGCDLAQVGHRRQGAADLSLIYTSPSPRD